MRSLNLIGQRFGRLTVVGPIKTPERILWKCLCDCGGKSVSASYQLKTGKTSSCGCLKIERIKESRTTHGLSNTLEYKIWLGIKSRCNIPTATGYENYGGRGIKMCDRWSESFETFMTDMGPRPGPEYSVERENSNGNYEPSNCRWATDVEQNRNSSHNKVVEYLGEKYVLSELAERLEIDYGLLQYRVRQGWAPDDIVPLLLNDGKPIRLGTKFGLPPHQVS